MGVEAALLIISLVKVYGMIGAGVAIVFLVFGLDRIDPAARGAYAFRPLLVPGILMLWPVTLWRWLALERNRS